MERYYIAAKVVGYDDTIEERFYATDGNTCAPYFHPNITNPEVEEFGSLECAKEFLRHKYRLIKGKLEFIGYAGPTIIGLPYIVKMIPKIERVYELV